MVTSQRHVGDGPCECPSLVPRAKWHRELLQDLLLGWDACLHLLHMGPRLPTLHSASIHSWQSQEPSICGGQWAASLQPL